MRLHIKALITYIMDEIKILKNCNLITDKEIINNIDIEIFGERVINIGKIEKQGVDCTDKYVSAGFVDIHTHGGYGYDFMDATTTAFDGVLKFHLENGTTSVLATSLTAPVKSIIAFLDKCREYVNIESHDRANLVGAHLEGPFLSIRNKGAQKLEYLLNPVKDDYSFILDYKDIVKTVTISPELDIFGEMTKILTDNGIVVCGGHDDGIYPEFMPSVNNGLKHLTHIFCAMSELRFKDGYRNIGLREFGLINNDLTAEVIADNRHIPAELLQLIYKSKGADKICFVSDSLRPAGLEDNGGVYKLGKADDESSHQVKIKDGVAVLENESCFAGSIMPVSKMVKNAINAGIPICSAFAMGTVTPANIIGNNDLGRIKVGGKANLCVFDCQFNLLQVYKNGKLVVNRGM